MSCIARRSAVHPMGCIRVCICGERMGGRCVPPQVKIKSRSQIAVMLVSNLETNSAWSYTSVFKSDKAILFLPDMHGC